MTRARRPAIPPVPDPGSPADGALRALAHPLPAGMRDLLPREARRQNELAERVIRCFELFGYEQVNLPAFEYAGVLERGLGTLDPSEVLRFVEPETGEVVALRPDMTPQVARLIATRLSGWPPPARLCYRGSVLRRRRERARKRRQIEQAGFELIGQPGQTGDLEVLSVATSAVRAAGLRDFVLDLGHSRIAAAFIERVERRHWPALMEALQMKDSTTLAARARRAGLSSADVRGLSGLPALSGGEEVWQAADELLKSTAAEAPAAELRQLWEAAEREQLAPRVIVDLGEPRNLNYYSGPIFQILAEGPGEWVGSGGRYDGLLELFGVPLPAAGFAVDIDNLEWALRQAHPGSQATRVLVAVDSAELLKALRELGIACATAPGVRSLDYARAWGWSHLIVADDEVLALICVEDGSKVPLLAREPKERAEAVASHLSASIKRCQPL